ncbi:MAG: site-specific DNA-methyltransferase [Thermodesulfobacteriota bacterium]|nr:site-specific DNA-methyltransferase [Thermodesulfobacteriota bacterium]
MEKLDGKTIDIVADNISKLKALFPEAVTEGKIDFDILKELLGEYVDTREERYSFTWNGKTRARMLAQTPSTGTLRPCPEESVDWETTKNIFIEGDNLEVLKLFQKSYHKKIKAICIDPPYNTGHDFVYKDDFKDNIKNYKWITRQIDGEGRNISSNPETSGRYHTDWLNMMYPRLKLARNLLKDDGVIFIHIDDNEIANLRKMCDEIFGEENFEAQITWRRRHNQPNDKSKMVAKVADYILVFAKNSLILKETKKYYGLPLTKSRISEYNNPDNDPKGPWTSNPWKAAVGRGGSKYKIKTVNGTVYDEIWYGSKETFDEHIRNNRVHWTNNGGGYPRIKIYLDEAIKHGQAGINFFTHEKFGSNQEGSFELKTLLKKEGLFDNPKPIKLLKSLIKLATLDDGDIIFDFFSGSGGIGQAVYELNQEENTKRKFFGVQLPELIDPDQTAYKFCYKTIAEIAKERFRRAATKIKEEHPEYKGDLGFKVFKLDSTNTKPWEADFETLDENLLEDYITNIKPGRTESDILYEILLKYGLDLTLPIKEHTIAGQKVFDIGMGALIICLSDAVNLDLVEGIAGLKKELKPEIMRVVFKDSGFKDDVVKTNAVQILKQAGIEDVRSL